MGLKETTTRLSHSYKIEGWNFDLNSNSTIRRQYLDCKKSRNGTELPKFKQAIQNKQGATTNLDAYIESAQLTPGRYEFYESRPTQWYKSTGMFNFSKGNIPNVDQHIVDLARAKVLSKYYGKLAELQKPLNGQQFLGEFHQVIKFMKSPHKAGCDLIIAALGQRNRFKKGNLKGPALHSAMANSWLELRFGILPLISDLKGLAAIAKSKLREETTSTYRVYGKAESSSVETFEGGDIYGVTLMGTRTYTQKTEGIIRFGYHEAMLDEFQVMSEKLNNAFLDLGDIPGTAWELTPFSFLVDYFLNIGSIIESLTASTANVVWTSDSTITTRKVVTNIYAAKPIAERFKITDFIPAQFEYNIRSVTRRTAPPGIPPLVFSLPRSDIRLLNIAALMTGLLKKG